MWHLRPWHRSSDSARARTFVVKPCQFIDDAASFAEFGREVVAKANQIAHGMKQGERR
jgi:hypothetical protein